MANRYRIFRRGGATYYIHDSETGKQKSLSTRSRKEALRILHAHEEGRQEPNIARQIARAYLHAADPGYAVRTWKDVAVQITSTKQGSTLKRWLTALKDPSLRDLWPLIVVETRPEAFFASLNEGTVSTNVYLRRLHNYALDMTWILQPIIPRRQWPKIHFKDKRAITLEEHQRIVDREKNPERKAFYRLAWHLGASQSDVANLHAEDINWSSRTITFERMKLRHRAVAPPQIRFGPEVEAVFARLPRTGALFPCLSTVREADRATEFKQRCEGLRISGITLHSYRYAWAERAEACGYPERFAQKALGHNSKAVHRAYARRAQVTVPALEDFEKEFAANNIVPFRHEPVPKQTGAATR